VALKNVREIHRFQVRDAASLQEAARFCATKPTTAVEPIVEIKYLTEFGEEVSKLLTPRFKFFTSRIATGKFSDIGEIPAYDKIGLADALPLVVQEKINPELHTFLATLLRDDAQKIIYDKIQEVL
jgi:hypothetical protein